MIQLTQPAIKKPRGSYFPKLPQIGNSMFMVERLDGTVLYLGNSEPVARLINACMTPRAI
jgi:hypothetical protein